MRVAVLGAGVIGTTTAYALARDRHEVVVVDRRHEPAAETSHANGGLIHVSLVDPWNTPGLIWKLPGWLGRVDSPALIRPRALPGLMRWGLAFLRNSATDRHRRNTLTNLRLAMASAAALKRVRAEAGVAYDHGERGFLRLFRDRSSLDQALAFGRMLEPHGVVHRSLDVDQVLELEPALEPVRAELTGGVLFPDDESGDCGLFTRGLADVAAARHGVAFRFETTIERLESENGRVTAAQTSGGRIEADAFVLACGSYSPALARTAGLELPIYPVKGYSLTVPLDGWNAAPRMPVSDEALKMGVVPLGNRLRLAGSAEFAGHDPVADPRRARYIWNSAIKVYPALRDHVDPAAIEPWSGLRPMTPEGVPILGATPVTNLFLNTGHGHLGWTMACGSADVLAAVVGGKPPPIDLDGLTYARYRRA